ncbi:MAG: radical SAM protein [Bacillota bacterium]
MSYNYLKGPVFSRRLGKSLGINIINDKSCSFDCVYCEVGKTLNLTIKRKKYTPTIKIIKELDDFLSKNPDLDYITFSSTGEPTLHSEINNIIKFIKDNYSQYKIALLTNSSLLWKESVRKEISSVDLIVPSLDAVSEDIFKKINYPEGSLHIDKIIDGIIKLRKEFCGKIWLEIFIIPEVNNSSQEIKKFIKIIEKIKPDKVQINSLDRPGTKNWVKKLSNLDKKELKSYFSDVDIDIEIL